MKMPLNAGSEEGRHVRFCLKRSGGPASCPSIGNTFILSKGTTIVGRNPARSDIYLDSTIHKALISRLHARISVGCDNKVKICDTSLNGTYVNDRKILDTVDINPGDTVTFGHLKGAVLVPGTVAKQPKSEFRFKLEKYEENNIHESTIDSGKENFQANIKKTDSCIQGFIPNLSSFIRNNKTNSKDPNETAKRVAAEDDYMCLSNGATDSRSTANSDILVYDNDDDELMAFAVAAGGAMDEESDPELFSVNLPNPSSDIDIDRSSISPIYSSEKTLEKVEEIIQVKNIDTCTNTTLDLADGTGREEDTACEKTPKQEKTSKRSKRKSLSGSRKKRKHVKPPTSDKDAVPDMCGFGVDCLCPHNQHEIVNWVQCDYCQKWYHLECAGLTIDNVAGKSRKFNCGCS